MIFRISITARILVLEMPVLSRKVYIQSAYAMPTEEKMEAELRLLAFMGDSFPKIIVRKDIGKR